MKKVVLAAAAALSVVSTSFAVPQYTVIDLSVTSNPLLKGNRLEGVSSNGVYAAGWGRRTNAGGTFQGNEVFAGPLATPPLTQLTGTAGRGFHFATGVNNSGTVAGYSATTAFFSAPLPVLWNGGVATNLALPSGATNGRLEAINNGGATTGSVFSATGAQAAAFWSSAGVGTVIGPMPDGGTTTTSYGINSSGVIIGTGNDPASAAANRGFVRQANGTLSVIPATAGRNSVLPFGINDSGLIVGSSSINGGSSAQAFYYTPGGGSTPITMPSGGDGIADAVNNLGVVIGRDTSGTGFYYDTTTGTNTAVTLASLVGDASAAGWNLQAPFSISDTGIIVGQGFFGGNQNDIRAFALVPIVPEPMSLGLLSAGSLLLLARRRKA